jgi:hypothetical protein
MRSVSDPRAIHAIKCDPSAIRAIRERLVRSARERLRQLATTCDRLAVSGDDLRALATTYEDPFTSFPTISDHVHLGANLRSSPYFGFSLFSLVHTCILLSFCVFSYCSSFLHSHFSVFTL